MVILFKHNSYLTKTFSQISFDYKTLLKRYASSELEQKSYTMGSNSTSSKQIYRSFSLEYKKNATVFSRKQQETFLKLCRTNRRLIETEDGLIQLSNIVKQPVTDCYYHYYTVIYTNRTGQPKLTKEEQSLILHLYKLNFSVVQVARLLGRSRFIVRNFLIPALSNRNKQKIWTQLELDLLKHATLEYPIDWIKVSKLIQTKTPVSCKTKYVPGRENMQPDKIPITKDEITIFRKLRDLEMSIDKILILFPGRSYKTMIKTKPFEINIEDLCKHKYVSFMDCFIEFGFDFNKIRHVVDLYVSDEKLKLIYDRIYKQRLKESSYCINFIDIEFIKKYEYEKGLKNL